ncbi:hypothetical protein RRG08_052779 [Elysia crispata]|uniref:Uncharacterized protein n=1 Tax=Elysia crispata TaxID=231223 RepID=A0AAE1B7P5_9GAST|nr:hypothetical protein RRG08_052779 [Elysia crispata]
MNESLAGFNSWLGSPDAHHKKVANLFGACTSVMHPVVNQHVQLGSIDLSDTRRDHKLSQGVQVSQPGRPERSGRGRYGIRWRHRAVTFFRAPPSLHRPPPGSDNPPSVTTAERQRRMMDGCWVSATGLREGLMRQISDCAENIKIFPQIRSTMDE